MKRFVTMFGRLEQKTGAGGMWEKNIVACLLAGGWRNGREEHCSAGGSPAERGEYYHPKKIEGMPCNIANLQCKAWEPLGCLKKANAGLSKRKKKAKAGLKKGSGKERASSWTGVNILLHLPDAHCAASRRRWDAGCWRDDTSFPPLRLREIQRQWGAHDKLNIGSGRDSTAVFSYKKLPPQTPNFPSHLHHIKTLNIANDSCMEY